MAHTTQPYKRSFSGSVGAGFNSIIGGGGKQYYILEHKISSKYHKVGESQEIIVDQIELGRDAKCQVRFDDSFPTVSRRHAAIIKEADKWKLVQLSQTNPTFLNGRKVGAEWYLQSGDEIQLAVGGPKLGFIVPAGKKSTVGSIGLSRRLSLFRQQALRPYKTAITLLCILLLLSVGGLSGWIVLNEKNWEEKQKIAEEAYNKELVRRDSIFDVSLAEMAIKIKEAEDRTEIIRREMDRRNAETIQNPSVSSSLTEDEAIRPCEPFVYHIRNSKLVITDLDRTTTEMEGSWIGTGFLLNDGRFVTARHVSEPWYYLAGEENQLMYILNYIAHNGGKVVAHFTAYSSSGDSFSFTSEQFMCNRSQDNSYRDDDGDLFKLANLDHTDWAYIRTSKTQGLNYDKARSENIGRGIELKILGFPLGIGANSPSDITPQLSTGTTTANGLTDNVILTANTSFEQGNSGGPVFYKEGNNLTVVGIVSAGAGRSTGMIVPIVQIDNN